METSTAVKANKYKGLNLLFKRNLEFTRKIKQIYPIKKIIHFFYRILLKQLNIK